MKNDNILNPVATVPIRGHSVEVRELRWRDYLKVIKDMTSAAFELFGSAGGKVAIDEFSLSKEKLISVIAQQEELLAWTIDKATNLKEFKIEVADLSGTEALTILNKIVEMNIRPELVELGKSLAGRMGELFQVKNPSSEQLTASSRPATTH